MNIDLHLTSQQTFQLARAILIYTHDNQACATTHEIELVNRRPVLCAGHPISLDGLQALARQLSGDTGAQFLPPHVLSFGAGRCAWWTPGRRARIWFKPHDDNPEAAALRALNGKTVFHPPLVFSVGQRTIHVAALATEERPTLKTRLYRAPYFNLGHDGMLCQGSARFPEQPTPGNLATYERAFFESAFTHTNVHGDKLHVRPGHAAFWSALADRRRAPDAAFWRQQLIPRQSLKDFLK